jgi:hypothetical protein
LVTSPFLAEQVLLPIDARLAAACRAAGLIYTRYVDDVTISGNFDLGRSGFETVVGQVLREHGFKMHPDKVNYGRLADETPITKIVARNGHPDVRREYLDELERQLDDANSLGRGGEFTGPYYTRNQIAGRVRFVCWINPGRRRQLSVKFGAVTWNQVSSEAVKRRLVVARKRLVQPGEAVI